MKLLVQLLIITTTTAANTPVVIIPGTAGNRLQGKLNKEAHSPHFYCEKTSDDWFDLWLSITQLLPGAIDCWCENISLIYDEAADTLRNWPGVETRVPCFGDVCGIEYLDTDITVSDSAYFADIIKAFEDSGYKRGVDLVSAPYDWRFAANSNNGNYINNTIALIEKMYSDNEDTPVMLLTHSMGGLWSAHILRSEVDEEWKAKYLKSYVPIAPAFGGSVNEFKVFATGQADDLPGISSSTLRDEQRTYESNYWLLPNAELWPEGEAVVTTAEGKTYNSHNLDQFFDDIGYGVGKKVTKRLEGIVSVEDVHMHDIHIFYGKDVDTDESYEYTKAGSWEEEGMKTKVGDGDGTVNIRSREAGNGWGGVVEAVAMGGETHQGILKNKVLIEKLLELAKT